MSKFKVGDKVVRSVGSHDDEDFLCMLGEADYYMVTSVCSAGSWLQVNGVATRCDEHPWACVNFELYQEPEEELPPVPSSVSYLNTKRDRGNDQRLVLERDSETDEGLLYIGIVPRKGSTRAEREIGINMSPDTALQLAHDIRHMAMAVKRERK